MLGPGCSENHLFSEECTMGWVNRQTMISILENSFYTYKAHCGLGVCVCVRESERERERGWLWDFERRLIECGIWTSWRVSKMGWVCLNFVGFRFELGSKCFKFKHNFSKRKFITKQTPTTRKGTTQSSK